MSLEKEYFPSLKTSKNSNLVICNIQPSFLESLTFDPKLIGGYAKNFKNIYYLFEPENNFNESSVYAFLEDFCNFDLEDLSNLNILEKEDGFFLDLFDFNLSDKVLLELILFLKTTKTNKISKMTKEDFESLQISKKIKWEDFKFQKFELSQSYFDFNLNNFTFIGGPDDILWEWELLFLSKKLNYLIDYNFTF